MLIHSHRRSHYPRLLFQKVFDGSPPHILLIRITDNVMLLSHYVRWWRHWCLTRYKTVVVIITWFALLSSSSSPLSKSVLHPRDLVLKSILFVLLFAVYWWFLLLAIWNISNLLRMFYEFNQDFSSFLYLLTQIYNKWSVQLVFK